MCCENYHYTFGSLDNKNRPVLCKDNIVKKSNPFKNCFRRNPTKGKYLIVLDKFKYFKTKGDGWLDPILNYWNRSSEIVESTLLR